MQLIIMRHADSLPSSSETGDRVLSEQGRGEAARCAALLRDKLHITRILTSPATRARQTAEIIAGELGLEVGDDANLSPSGDAEEAVRDVLSQAGEDDCILLVSHIPTVEYIMMALNPHLPMPHFDTGAALVLHKWGDHWSVDELIAP